MIPVGTILQPRAKSDPEVRVCGVEGDRYVLAPTEFGPNFALDFDGIAAAYRCDGYVVHIEPFDEQAAWRRLSAEKFDGRRERRHRRKQEAEPTPEQIFARAAEAD